MHVPVHIYIYVDRRVHNMYMYIFICYVIYMYLCYCKCQNFAKPCDLLVERRFLPNGVSKTCLLLK
jgi:hypothetical protein